MPSFSSRVQLTNAATGSNIVLADVQRIKGAFKTYISASVMNSTSVNYGKEWKHSDVLGCLADLDEKKIECFLNGESMGMAFENIKIDGKLRIAVTAQGQKLRINVGDDNMKFSPL